MKSHIELAFLLPFWIHTCQLEAWALGQFQMLHTTGLLGPGRVTVTNAPPSSHTASPEELEKPILFLFI